ncbi:MAG: hypothetical protein IJ062_04780 [Firmicutes bacterium]|nr:hypothetical protein [Bacillota bacterium]
MEAGIWNSLKCNNCGENEIFIFKLSELLFDFSDVLSIKCGHCGNTMCFDKSKLSAVSDEVKNKSGGIVMLLCIGLLRVLQAGRESGDMDAALASIMIYALLWLAYAFYRYNSFKRTVLYKLYVEDDVSKFRFVGIDKSVK